MAHTKATGATKLGRESESKRLGVKIFDGEKVKPGEIIIRQRGSKYLAGANVKVADDDTLYAVKSGFVKFLGKRKIRFDGKPREAKIVSVVEKN